MSKNIRHRKNSERKHLNFAIDRQAYWLQRSREAALSGINGGCELARD